MKKLPWFFVALPILLATACSTGNGGTVLPSPTGDMAINRACREAAPDIIPSVPISTASLWMGEGRGSSADSLEALRMGFERVSFDVTGENLSQASALSPTDTLRWSQVPLTTQIGAVTLAVAERGDARCTAFEREVEGQRNSTDPKANTDDPMKYWTDTRYPAAPPEGRNWCIATLAEADSNALRFTRTDTSSKEGQSNVSTMIETVTDASGNILARRTFIRMTRPSFPIGVSGVSTGCDGATIGVLPEFFGPTGIALRPASPPTLINK
jgi:hypothetical protein